MYTINPRLLGEFERSCDGVDAGVRRGRRAYFFFAAS